MSDLLIMLLVCVELNKIPLLYKLKQLYKRLPVDLFNHILLITYCISLQKQVGCFNHKVRDSGYERFALVWKSNCIRQPKMQLPSSS